MQLISWKSEFRAGQLEGYKYSPRSHMEGSTIPARILKISCPTRLLEEQREKHVRLKSETDQWSMGLSFYRADVSRHIFVSVG